MIKEFEGKTEQEAIDAAAAELGLDQGSFDVEVISSQKKGLFKKGCVTIRVYVADDEEKYDVPKTSDSEYMIPGQQLETENDVEKKTVQFLTTLIEKMGYKATVTVSFRRDNKIGFNIASDNSSIIIGRKGKNLDAIQLVANIYAGNLDPDVKVVVDSENYRMRHEETIIRNAFKDAEYVKRTGRSKLLEPMNPFERRLVHTALNDFEGIETKSEGEGLYKQIRISPVK